MKNEESMKRDVLQNDEVLACLKKTNDHAT